MLSEDLIEKYCTLLGTTFAGVVSYEDRVMANYLASRPEVEQNRIGCIGLSGGGCRSAMLGATSDKVSAAVVVGMMSTFAGLLDHNVVSHTWMFFPHGWPRYGDWTDLTAARAPSPLLVQYNINDELFTEEGMHAADVRLAGHFRSVNAEQNYRGEFYPGPHKFDLEMQISAFRWLHEQLG
jgi:dienelactone hydrolase